MFFPPPAFGLDARILGMISVRCLVELYMIMMFIGIIFLCSGSLHVRIVIEWLIILGHYIIKARLALLGLLAFSSLVVL